MKRSNGAPAQVGTEKFLLTDLSNGEDLWVTGDDVVRIIGVELDYIIWAIRYDGVFENGRWKVAADHGSILYVNNR